MDVCWVCCASSSQDCGSVRIHGKFTVDSHGYYNITLFFFYFIISGLYFFLTVDLVPPRQQKSRKQVPIFLRIVPNTSKFHDKENGIQWNQTHKGYKKLHIYCKAYFTPGQICHCTYHPKNSMHIRERRHLW